MNDRMGPGMAEATRLTRGGQLSEATALIQHALRGMLKSHATANTTDEPVDAPFRVFDADPLPADGSAQAPNRQSDTHKLAAPDVTVSTHERESAYPERTDTRSVADIPLAALCGVLGVFSSALAAALPVSWLVTLFAVVSACCFAVIGFVSPERRYLGLIRAWRTLDVAATQYKNGLLSLKELLAWLKRCEEVATEPSMHELPLEQLSLHLKADERAKKIAESAFRIINWTKRSFREAGRYFGACAYTEMNRNIGDQTPQPAVGFLTKLSVKWLWNPSSVYIWTPPGLQGEKH